MAQLLRNVDADEVSPVRRGANRKRVVLKADGEVEVQAEIADIMAVPWENEGSMVDSLRKEDTDESVIKAAVGAMRLLKGVADELPDGMREAVEKLGSQMYPRANPPLNTTGVPSMGGLDGSSYGDPKDGSAGTQTELDGSGRDGELEGSGSAPKVAADSCDDDMDADDDVKKKKRKKMVEKAFDVLKDALGVGATEDLPVEAGAEDPVVKTGDTTDAVEKGGQVDTHAVPIQKEDGSWDLSGVPDGARPFYESMIAKADEAAATAVKLEKAEETVAELTDTLRTKDIIAKAEGEFAHIGARDDVVSVLKEAGSKLSPEAYESLVTLLASADSRIEKGDLFTEMGRNALGDGAGGDSWAKIEKAADDLVEKSDTGMTRAQAVTRVLDTPEGGALYAAYMRENGMAVS